jgi:hypothetical protein
LHPLLAVNGEDCFLIGSSTGVHRFSLTAHKSVRKANLKSPHTSLSKQGFMFGGWNDVQSNIATYDIQIAAEPVAITRRCRTGGQQNTVVF